MLRRASYRDKRSMKSAREASAECLGIDLRLQLRLLLLLRRLLLLLNFGTNGRLQMKSGRKVSTVGMLRLLLGLLLYSDNSLRLQLSLLLWLRGRRRGYSYSWVHLGACKNSTSSHVIVMLPL